MLRADQGSLERRIWILSKIRNSFEAEEDLALRFKPFVEDVKYDASVDQCSIGVVVYLGSLPYSNNFLSPSSNNFEFRCLFLW